MLACLVWSAAFAPSSASRGTTSLAAAPYERYLDAKYDEVWEREFA